MKRFTFFDKGGEPSRVPHAPDRSQGIDIVYLFDILRGNARLISVVTLVCLVGTFFYLQRVTPIYTAHSQIIIDTRQERVTPVEEVVSSLNVSNSVVAGEVVTIQSNVLIGKVVDTLDLVHHPQFDPRLPRPEGPIAGIKRLIRGEEPFHVIARRFPDEALRSIVINDVRQRLSVSQIGVSYAIGVRFDSPDPQLAADVANAVADQYIAGQLADKHDATVRANDWLADRIQELSAQVETADAAVVDFRIEMTSAAGGGEETTNQLLAELNSRLVATSAERADAEVRYRLVERLMESEGLAAVADVVTSPLLETLQRQQTDLTSKKAELASTLGRRHPEIIRITAQIEDVQRSIEDELRRRIESMRGDVSVTRNREAALQEQIKEVSDRAEMISTASVRLNQLERTAQATRLVYENFLSRFKETSAQSDYQRPEARVIGRAAVPLVPSFPRRTLSMAMAAVFGLSIGVAFVFLRSLFTVPIRTSDELREATNLPLLAMLPYVRSLGPRHAWLRRELRNEKPSAFMEGIQLIRTKLFEMSHGKPPNVVMVTSSLASEGKSSLCFALAHSLSKSGASVALLDADLRRSDSVRALGLPRKGTCLVDYLEGKGNFRDLIERSELLDADVITPRRSSNNAAGLISSKKMSGLITRLSARHDMVIINAPPVLQLSDALVLSNHVDTTLMAVQSGRPSARIVKQTLERLNEAGADVCGTVMTQVRRKDVAGREVYGYAYEY
ncbi:polysaccharide biosynthesis tyrosine autokinase [Actibacterium sp. MT2.3-13A]|uniref:GumC family protein n=1 Tax=Actibacterium sp. MT2.3-13A TaxID=2828332 RepID=UPI001BAA052C|nr:polysaccharide biosynthesis tyrosine autokinase [Actibacterium sp. MT2.3-13A]